MTWPQIGQPLPRAPDAYSSAIKTLVARHRLVKGRYSFALTPGRYTLVVTLRRPGPAKQSRTVYASEHRNKRVNFYFGLR